MIKRESQIDVDCIKYGEELIDGCCPNQLYELKSCLNLRVCRSVN